MKENITRLLVDASKRLEPLLAEALCSTSVYRIRLGFHIHDGHLNHIKEFSEEVVNEEASQFSTTKPSGERILKTISLCQRVLRIRLEPVFVPTWHGVVALSLEIDGGNCKITCSTEANDKQIFKKVSA